jgi:regulatory protein
LRERGWSGESEPPLDAIVARFADLGYVDDCALAEARGRALALRGYGVRRLGVALGVLGIAEEDGREARRQAEAIAWDTALSFARRRRFGPFAEQPPDRKAKRRAFAAMMRAGHTVDLVRRILAAPPGIVPKGDDE